MASFATFLVTTSLMFLIMALIHGEAATASLGINYGRQASQKLLPSMVVDMCLANQISKVKLFSMNEGVLSAFYATNIELIVAISNIELVDFINIAGKTDDWMNMYIKRYLPNDDREINIGERLNIRYLCVGVEPFSLIEQDWRKNASTVPEQVAPVLTKIDKIIRNDNQLNKTLKLAVPMATNILECGSKPSEGDFHKDFKKHIFDILPILSKMDSPFMINIYPYYIVTNETLPLEFGLFDERSNYTVIDGNLVYTNVFDLMYDTLVWALRKNGYGHMKIMVTQIGWPTDGGVGANVENAKRFYDGLLKKVGSNQGSPLIPGADLDVYLYVLSDENQRRIERGQFERHYGIYNADGKPKFNLDFTLQGRDIEPELARGVTYLPQRWCILNKPLAKKRGNEVVLQRLYDDTCKEADCTALVNGSSCSFLGFDDKVSYAFNILFQMKNQEVAGEEACDYEGLGEITTKRPRFAGCYFPVQILSTIFLNGMSNTEMIATLGKDSNNAVDEILQFSYPVVVLMISLIILTFLIYYFQLITMFMFIQNNH